jgi:hypothetical protein
MSTKGEGMNYNVYTGSSFVGSYDAEELAELVANLSEGGSVTLCIVREEADHEPACFDSGRCVGHEAYPGAGTLGLRYCDR